jgi:hypothetical protein
MRPQGLGKLEKNSPHLDANPQPSSLQHSALTTTLQQVTEELISTVKEIWKNWYVSDDGHAWLKHIVKRYISDQNKCYI